MYVIKTWHFAQYQFISQMLLPLYNEHLFMYRKNQFHMTWILPHAYFSGLFLSFFIPIYIIKTCHFAQNQFISQMLLPMRKNTIKWHYIVKSHSSYEEKTSFTVCWEWKSQLKHVLFFLVGGVRRGFIFIFCIFWFWFSLSWKNMDEFADLKGCISPVFQICQNNLNNFIRTSKFVFLSCSSSSSFNIIFQKTLLHVEHTFVWA